MLKLVHVNYIWVHSTFSLLPVLSPHLFFFQMTPLHSYSKFLLVGLNSGGQPLSYSIMVFPFNQLPQPHPISSAWGPDQMRLAYHAQCYNECFYSCEAVIFLSNQNKLMSTQNQIRKFR